MYGNNYGYYNPTRNIGVPTQPINNPYIQQPIQQPTQQPIQTPIQSGLQGKVVDSIDTAKNQDIPLDGSVSYFALTDGTCIITKQLQMDGTSKIVIFKPIDEEKASPKYITSEELEKSLKSIDLSEIDDLKDDIKDIRNELKELRKKKKEE